MSMIERRFWFVIDKGKLEYVQDNVTGEKITVTELEDLLNELIEKKDSLSMGIDENLLKGYHELSIKHKEAKEKMRHKEERIGASPLIDVVFYWAGYVKALEELKLKEGV